MNLKYIPIFSLIEIFRGIKKEKLTPIPIKTYCEQKHIQDFYCNAERPHIERSLQVRMCKGKN